MDQKRFIPFFAISMLIFFGWAMLARTFFPPEEQPPEQVAQIEGDAVEGEAAEGDQVAGDDLPSNEDSGSTEPKVPEVEDDQQQPTDEQDPSEEEPAEDEAIVTDTTKQQWFTLGSMKPSDPYQLAVTFNNEGATIENVELIRRNAKGEFRYRDLDDDTGYLGYLALSEAAEGGCQVESVVPGSPAAQAGLQQGDRLLSINETPISEPLTLNNWLHAKPNKKAAKPGAEVKLQVQRGGKPLTLAVTLTRRPLSVIAPEFQQLTDGSVIEHQHAFLLSLQRLGNTASKAGQNEIGGLRSLRKSHWEGKQIQQGNAPGVEFSLTLPSAAAVAEDTSLEIIKRYWLKPRATTDDDESVADSPGYDLAMEIEFRNTGSAATQLAYRLDGPTGLPKEGWWYANKIHPRHFFNALGARDVIWSAPATGSLFIGCSSLVKEAEDEESSGLKTLFAPPQPQPFTYAGVDAQYFSCVLMPQEAAEDDESYTPILLRDAYGFPITELAHKQEDKGRFKNSNVTFQLNSGLHELQPDESFSQRFTIFAGPKDPELLTHYQLEDTISYGWFGVVSKPLLKLLHGLYWITGSLSYGIAIVLLTLIVRSCLMPLGLKAARSAKKMQELAPEVKKIKEKYPDSVEKQWQAQQELFKKHKASQFGGCAPMFLQLPIFLGLYRGLAIDIHLRQAPLLPGVDWATNLAGPDKLFYWEPYIWQSLGGEMGWLGPYFNLLPVITVVLFYLHQKLFTPPATDDQQKQMQQVMSFMMIFFCVMFFKVPAGLCLYFITSSLWGLGERLFLKKESKKNGEADKPMPAAADAKRSKAREEKVERKKELARKQKKR